MRIKVDASLLAPDDYEDNYKKPEQRYVPGGSGLVNGEEELGAVQEEAVQAGVDARQEILDSIPRESQFRLGLDLNFRKLLTITALFLVMFMVPVAVSENLFSADNFRTKKVYTAKVVSQQQGKVAGIATSNKASAQNNLDEFSSRNIAGVSMGAIFIVLGLTMILLPVAFLLKQ